jgi:hypothetical protein
MFWTLNTMFAFAPIITVTVGLITKDVKKTTICSYVFLAASVYTMAGWTIYGYTLMVSGDNDCALNPASAGWNTAMIVCLVLGSFTLCYAGCLICLLPVMIKALG